MNIAISQEIKNNFESIYDLDNPAQFLFVFEKVISFYKKKNFTGLPEGSERAKKSVEKIAEKTGFGSKMVAETILLHEKAMRQNMYGLGLEDVNIFAIDEVVKIRTEGGIKDALKKRNYKKLYHALFPSELISREIFDQAVVENIDLYSVIKGFKYSLEYNNENVSQKFEMEGRMLLAYGMLKEALKYFDKAIDECLIRFQNYHGDPQAKSSARSFENDLPDIVKEIFFLKLQQKRK